MGIFVVGLGPGDMANLTPRALGALQSSRYILGYSRYISLIRERFPDKELLETGMGGERARCRRAVELALAGHTVSLVCSGDPGVYGMAGLVFEVAQGYEPVEIEVVPGVTAACSGAALLGAPLAHDFAVVSLSDLLTPWPLIEKRLALAAQADYVICLYNPASKGRPDTLKRACAVLCRHRAPDTPAGLVRNVGRDGQEKRLLPLGELGEARADMFTTVFVGNSQTRRLGEWLVTPRGYRDA